MSISTAVPQINGISFTFGKEGCIFWEIVCQVKSWDKQLYRRQTDSLPYISRTLRAVVVWFLFVQIMGWMKVTRAMTPDKWKHDVGIYYRYLITQLCNTHASCRLPIVETFGLFLAIDADFANWLVAFCCEFSPTKEHRLIGQCSPFIAV